MGRAISQRSVAKALGLLTQGPCRRFQKVGLVEHSQYSVFYGPGSWACTNVFCCLRDGQTVDEDLSPRI